MRFSVGTSSYGPSRAVSASLAMPAPAYDSAFRVATGSTLIARRVGSQEAPAP